MAAVLPDLIPRRGLHQRPDRPDGRRADGDIHSGPRWSLSRRVRVRPDRKRDLSRAHRTTIWVVQAGESQPCIDCGVLQSHRLYRTDLRRATPPRARCPSDRKPRSWRFHRRADAGGERAQPRRVQPRLRHLVHTLRALRAGARLSDRQVAVCAQSVGVDMDGLGRWLADIPVASAGEDLWPVLFGLGGLAELGLVAWLLVKGVNTQAREARAR